jgi:hypothetical protein
VTNETTLSSQPEKLDKLLTEYSEGKIGRKEVENETGLWFGDILAELGKRGLSLPTVDCTVWYTKQQKALFDDFFKAS